MATFFRVLASLIFVSMTSGAWADDSNPWSKRLTENVDGALRVYFYCTEYEAAVKAIDQFILIVGPERTFLHINYDNPPSLPGPLSSLLKLKQDWKELNPNELMNLSENEQQEYSLNKKKVAALNRYLDYFNNKRCFWHNSNYSFMFSIATDLEFVSEHLVKDPDGNTAGKMDIYKSTMQLGSTKPKGYIHVGPCPIVMDGSSMKKCLDIHR